jgi:hypothetical protein
VNKQLSVIELKKNNIAESAITQIKEIQILYKNYSGNILLVGITYDDDKKCFCKIEKIAKL